MKYKTKKRIGKACGVILLVALAATILAVYVGALVTIGWPELAPLLALPPLALLLIGWAAWGGNA